MSALLAREPAPPYYAVAAHKGHRRAARLRPQPTPDGVALRWLRVCGAHDALPVLTAHPTSLTSERLPAVRRRGAVPRRGRSPAAADAVNGHFGTSIFGH